MLNYHTRVDGQRNTGRLPFVFDSKILVSNTGHRKALQRLSMHASSSPESPIAGAEGVDGPLVSVGIPVFNGERFVRQAIDSILAQSHRNLELIVSDNASTDGTSAIGREYAMRDPRVRYFRQQRNIGAPGNWNFVATQARGKYMKWGSANDYCDKKMLTACVEVLESDPRVVLCYGTTRLVDEVTGTMQSFDGDFSLTEERPSVRLSRLLSEMSLNNPQSGVIRMDVLRKTGLERPYPSGDLVLMAELAMAGMFILLPQPFQYRRIGARTFSSFLSGTELRQFLDPQGKLRPGFDRLRLYADFFLSVMRARMPAQEKRRALTRVARSAYWDFAARRARQTSIFPTSRH
jgi:Glycosyl transferase family 2